MRKGKPMTKKLGIKEKWLLWWCKVVKDRGNQTGWSFSQLLREVGMYLISGVILIQGLLFMYI